MKYKYTLTLAGFRTIQREAAHPIYGWEGGLETVMKSANYINVTRGEKTVKRIMLTMHDGSKLYSLADWRSWNKNPTAILFRTLNDSE